MEKSNTFYFIALRDGDFNGIKYYRLDFIDYAGNKYSVSCSSDMYYFIAHMDIPKFAQIDIGFSVVPSYGKMKISVADIDVIN